jgi:hypothetical protein
VAELALLDVAGERVMVGMETRGAYHRFQYGDRKYVVPANGRIPPVLLPVVEDDRKWWQWRSSMADRGVRFFRIIGRGAVEVPVSLALDGGAQAMDEYTQALVKQAPDGRPVLNAQAYKRMVDRAEAAGVDTAHIHRIAAAMLSVQEHGMLAQYDDEVFLDHLQPKPVAVADFGAVAVASGYIVWNLAAASPGLVERWGSDPRFQSLTLLAVAASWLAAILIRKFLGRRQA